MNTLILTGGSLQKTFATNFLKTQQFDFIITADSGLDHAQTLGLKVDIILGDFDSLSPHTLEQYKQKGIPIKTFPPEKDYTDTHLAIETAIEYQASHITILCGTGTRLDHTLANIGLLKLCLSKGIPCDIIDANNHISMMTSERPLTLSQKSLHGPNISLLSYTEQVTGINLTGFKYPLTNESLTIGISRGISNELTEEQGTITIESGILIIIVSRD